MRQKFSYRGIFYVIEKNYGPARSWSIHPPNGPDSGARYGTVRVNGPGTFRAAVEAAQKAIDDWLDDAGDQPEPKSAVFSD